VLGGLYNSIALVMFWRDCSGPECDFDYEDVVSCVYRIFYGEKELEELHYCINLLLVAEGSA